MILLHDGFREIFGGGRPVTVQVRRDNCCAWVELSFADTATARKVRGGGYVIPRDHEGHAMR